MLDKIQRKTDGYEISDWWNTMMEKPNYKVEGKIIK